MGLFNVMFGGIRGGVGDLDEPPAQITHFGGIANVRPEIGVFPQEAPDPIRQGDVPSRPAVMPIVVLTGIEPDAVAEGRFIAAIIGPPPHASFPRTRMTPDYGRTNIRVPSHVAYGSLFTSAPARGY